MYENFESLANAIILQAVRDYRHTYSPQVRAEIKRFFRSEWFRALTRVDGEMIIARLESFQCSEFKCIENEEAIVSLREALISMNYRRIKRIKRGVESTNNI